MYVSVSFTQGQISISRDSKIYQEIQFKDILQVGQVDFHKTEDSKNKFKSYHSFILEVKPETQHYFYTLDLQVHNLWLKSFKKAI